MKKIKKTGFTLFELLVSISIIAILIAIASFSYSSAQKKARDAKRIQDVGSVQKAAEQYYSMNNSVYLAPGGGNSIPAVGSWGGILQQTPVDPKNTGSYVYRYSTVVSTADYCICAYMENLGKGNSIDNACNFTGAGSKDYYCAKSQQ